MAIDVRQIGGIKANDSSDSALIAALDSRYGNSLGSGGGATVLPTFNSTNTVIFGSPGVSITPASTGSSTYNVQLGLPASLEAVTGGSGSLSPSSTPTLTFDNSSGIETVSSGNGGLTISLKSGQTTDYYVSLKLPTSLLVGGNSAVSVGTTLNKGSVTFSSAADSYGVFPESTSANTYNLNLVLPVGATVTGTGGGGPQDITFNTVPAEYTASPATSAQVSIDGTGTSRNVKLILPATASMNGSGGGSIKSVTEGTWNSLSATPKINPVTTNGEVKINYTIPSYEQFLSVNPTSNSTIFTSDAVCWTEISVDGTTDLNEAGGGAIKEQSKPGLSCVHIVYGSGSGEQAYGFWLQTGNSSVGSANSGVGLFIQESSTNDADFRVAYSFSGDNNLHGFKLFDLKNYSSGTPNRQSLALVDLRATTPSGAGLNPLMVITKDTNHEILSNIPEGMSPVAFTFCDTTGPYNPTQGHTAQHYYGSYLRIGNVGGGYMLADDSKLYASYYLNDHFVNHLIKIEATSS